jgi:prepilin-type N-terminal cleavage/methylation domain-containing protein
VKRARRDQGGFTLIEIMISLVISSLLVAMILSIFTSMSAAYRTQQQVAELQQVLQAAESTVEADLRQAGFRCPQGFTYGGGGAALQPALRITDGGGGQQQPDQIAVFYADPSVQAQVTNASFPTTGTAFTSVTVDSAAGFTQGMVVLFTVGNSNTTMISGHTGLVRPPEEPAVIDTSANTAQVPIFYACTLQVASVNANTITFSTAGPWGSSQNAHCTYAAGAPGAGQPAGPTVMANTLKATQGYIPPMLYRFVARAYRIDPARKNLSVFQRSISGGLDPVNDWQDLGLGFTNFQIASRWYERFLPPGQSITTAVDNADSDTDDYRNWYSGSAQVTRSAQSAGGYNGDPNQLVAALQLSVSFVVRTTRPVVDGTVTSATPAILDLTNAANVNFNDVGNSPAVPLAGVADSSRPVELRGNNIYRYATIKIDTRNLGVGR